MQAAPGPAPSSSPSSSASTDGDEEPSPTRGTQRPTPSGNLTVRLEAEETLVRPGHVVAFHAVGTNEGNESAWFPSASCSPSVPSPFSLRVLGPGGPVYTYGDGTSSSCPSGPSGPGYDDWSPALVEIPPGGTQRQDFSWDGRLPSLAGVGLRTDAPPGEYRFTVTMHGFADSLDVTVPVVPVVSGNASAALVNQGETASVHVTLENPTDSDVWIDVGCNGAPWAVMVTAGSYDNQWTPIIRGSAEPADCLGSGPRLLAPGERIEQDFTWNGTAYNSLEDRWTTLGGYLYFEVRASYGPSRTAVDAESATAWASFYSCGPGTQPCA